MPRPRSTDIGGNTFRSESSLGCGAGSADTVRTRCLVEVSRASCSQRRGEKASCCKTDGGLTGSMSGRAQGHSSQCVPASESVTAASRARTSRGTPRSGGARARIPAQPVRARRSPLVPRPATHLERLASVILNTHYAQTMPFPPDAPGTIRAKVEDGRLPVGRPARMWAGGGMVRSNSRQRRVRRGSRC